MTATEIARRRKDDEPSARFDLIMVKVEAVAVQIVDRELPQPHGFFSRGSTMFAPDDFSSLYVASTSSANTQ